MPITTTAGHRHAEHGRSTERLAERLCPAAASSARDIALLPDAGPLTTLAYADALDVLLKPGWTLMLVDMVVHEVTRNQTPASTSLAVWAASAQIPILPTKTFEHFR